MLRGPSRVPPVRLSGAVLQNAGAVHDRVHPLEKRQPLFRIGYAGEVQADPPGSRPALPQPACEANHLMPFRSQPGRNGRAHKSRRARDEDHTTGRGFHNHLLSSTGAREFLSPG